MSSVLFRAAPPAVDAIIQERHRTGVDRFDEVWDGVYVVNPPPSFRHSTIAGLIVDLLRPPAEAIDLVVRREVGIGRHENHRIPDVVVARIADLDPQGHYLLTAAIVVEVRSPGERIDKRPFYGSCGVAEVVLVDPASGIVEWSVLTPDAAGYEPVVASAILPLGPSAVAALLDP